MRWQIRDATMRERSPRTTLSHAHHSPTPEWMHPLKQAWSGLRHLDFEQWSLIRRLAFVIFHLPSFVT